MYLRKCCSLIVTTTSTTDVADTAQGMLCPTLYSVLTLTQIVLQHHGHHITMVVRF